MTWDGLERRKDVLDVINTLVLQLNTLTIALNHDRENNTIHIKKLLELVEKHEFLLHGQGDKKGILERQRFLEEAKREQDKHIWAVSAASITAVVGMVWQWVKKSMGL